jgi:fusion protein PurCD
VFPAVEFVAGLSITGSTSTSMWTNYNKARDYCGHMLPEGLKKNQNFDCIKLTPPPRTQER